MRYGFKISKIESFRAV